MPSEPDSELTNIEKKIISLVQADIPVTERPFLEIAEQIGVEEEVVLETLRRLQRNGTIRRFGVTIRTRFLDMTQMPWGPGRWMKIG